MADDSVPTAPINLHQSYIRTHFHEFSGLPDEYTPLDQYFQRKAPSSTGSDENTNMSAPWDPFDTYEDFTFFEWAISAKLSAKEIDNFLYLICPKCVFPPTMLYKT
jgi:hypothetical protein